MNYAEIHDSIDLAAVEREARQLQARVLADGFSTLVERVRNLFSRDQVA